MPTKIEWTDETWNPVTGCTKVSTGCENCYAESMARRLRGRFGYPADEPFRVTLHPDRLEIPLKWRKPRMIFVCSMGDLFHPSVPFHFVESVWDTMFDAPKHTFMILTKRPERALEFTNLMYNIRYRRTDYNNVWIGASVEDQRTAHERIPFLLEIRASVLFVSCEPLLGPINFSLVRSPRWRDRWIDWIIVGGETGPGARFMAHYWARNIKFQCMGAGVPFFMKQMSNRKPIPVDLMIREYPK